MAYAVTLVSKHLIYMVLDGDGSHLQPSLCRHHSIIINDIYIKMSS